MQRKSEGASESIGPAIEKALAKLPAGATRREKVFCVSHILFLEFGVHPSATTVLKYIGQGSYTDIGKDLRDFWSDLRTKMSVRLSAPALPDELLNTFSSALVTIWELASSRAHDELRVLRQECEDEVSKANLAIEAAQRDYAAAQLRSDESAAEMLKERERREAAERRIEGQASEIQALNQSVDSWQRQVETVAAARREAEALFAKELESERGARRREAERFTGEINFAKRQIDAARTSERELKEQIVFEKESRQTEISTYRLRMNKAEEDAAATKAKLAAANAEKKWLEDKLAELQERVRELAKVSGARSTVRKPIKRKSLR